MSSFEPQVLDKVVEHSLYGYTPTLWICTLFVTLFSITTLVHAGQATYYRMWWLLPTVCLAGIAEVIGWSGRLWSSKNIHLLTPFLMQITTTIIAPTPLVAANFVILGRLISRLGSRYSRLSGKWYLIIFTTADIVALVVQAVGGASASIAVENDKSAVKGGNIMLGGIAFQLGAITIYSLLAAEFVLRYLYDRPIRSSRRTAAEAGQVHYFDRRTTLMLTGMAFSSVLIFIRSVYRTIELSDGWSGRIITTQVYFNVLDGGMIVAAMFTLNFLHPGFLLIQAAPGKGDSESDVSEKHPATSETTTV